MVELKIVECNRCGKIACFVEASWYDDIQYHIWCKECVVLQVKQTVGGKSE